MIYAFWRGIYLIDQSQKVFPIFHNVQPPNWIKYNLPDGLWMYAFLSTIFIIWKSQISKHFVAWLLLAIIMSFFLEILQGLHLIPGTYDWFDMLAYAISIFIFILTKMDSKEKSIFINKNLLQ
jgi:hypothetical protein